MSRTLRRKQFINTAFKGSRYFDRWRFYHWVRVGLYNEYVPIDKDDEPNAWSRAFYKCHGESRPHDRGPGKEIRNYREGQFRAFVRAELKKSDDPVLPDHGARNWWDWS